MILPIAAIFARLAAARRSRGAACARLQRGGAGGPARSRPTLAQRESGRADQSGRPIRIETLWPPNPSELQSALRTSISRALPAM